MKTTGHTAKTASTPSIGLRALLRGLLRRKGSGAPSALLLAPVLVVAVLAFAAAPALAAEPETPTGEGVVEVGVNTAKLKGVLYPNKPGEPGRYWFHYAVSATACGAETESMGGEGKATGHSPQQVEGEVTNLLANTTYSFCLEVENEAGERAAGAPVSFKTIPGAPLVAMERAASTSATAATVSAEITPNGLPTSYHVEYVSQDQFQADEWAEAMRVPASDAELPAGSTPIAVSESLGGLQPETPYRYRYVATNSGTVPGEKAISTGEEATFTTTSAAVSSSSLPDGRAYELVSTSGEYGEPYQPTSPSYGPAIFFSEFPVEAATDGEALAYVGEAAAAGGNGNQGDLDGDEWLAERGSHGWEDQIISPGGSDNSEDTYSHFQAFSPDLSNAILATEPGKGCAALYSRAATTGVYTALLTESKTPGECGHPDFAGSSEDQSDIIFESEAALTANAEEASEIPAGHNNSHTGGYDTGDQRCMFGCNLYDSISGKLLLVNVLPGPAAKTVPNATFGGYAGKEKTDFSNAISADGSRIFWTDTQEGPEMEHIYVLEDDTKEVQVSGSDPAEYWTATPDGRYAYYTENGELWRFDTDTQERSRLTPGDYSATGTGSLTGPGSGKGTITEGSNIVTGVVTSSGAFAVGQAIKGEENCEVGCFPAGVKITAVAQVTPTEETLTLSADAEESRTDVGISADSNEITSVATANGQFREGEPIFGLGIPAGTTITAVTATTIELSNSATAPEADVALEAGGSVVQGVIGANQTGKDGAYVYFVAGGVLASNENANKETAAQGRLAGDPNLYLLHEGSVTFVATLAPEDDNVLAAKQAPGRQGDWAADPGERTAEVTPDGEHIAFDSVRKLTGYDNLFVKHGGETAVQSEVFVYSAAGAQLACVTCSPTGVLPKLPEAAVEANVSQVPVSRENNTYMRRWISSDGNRVFFQTYAPLVPQDTDGVMDVYEWEREGFGTCTAEESSRWNDGCVSLLSGGESSQPSLLVDADENGENVFLEHFGRLGQANVPADRNEIYDARVNGGYSQSSLACTGTGCQGVPPAPPIFATPASATFTGLGNFAAPAPSKAAVKSPTPAQKLARALKTCHKDKRKAKRTRCEVAARRKYGTKSRSSAKKAGNERRAK